MANPPPIIHVRGILAAGPHDTTQDFGIVAGLNDGTKAVIQIDKSLMNGLELLIKDYLSKLTYSDEGGTIAGRAMRLTSCQPFVDGVGSVGMVLQIEHLRLPIVFGVDGVPALIEGLTRMAAKASKPDSAAAN